MSDEHELTYEESACLTQYRAALQPGETGVLATCVAIIDKLLARTAPATPIRPTPPCAGIEIQNCDDHRLELFQTTCRGCGNTDVSFARRAAYPDRPMSAICAACGVWEIIG